jgi:cell division protein FtsX
MRIFIECDRTNTYLTYNGTSREIYQNQTINVYHFMGGSVHACPRNRAHVWIIIVVIVVVLFLLLASLLIAKGAFKKLHKYWRRDREDQTLLKHQYDNAPQITIMTYDTNEKAT